MRPGQTVNTPEGPGVVLHPIFPGHPEKAWWVLFEKTAKSFEVNEVQVNEVGVSVSETIER
jgi:hypothetical protein